MSLVNLLQLRTEQGKESTTSGTKKPTPPSKVVAANVEQFVQEETSVEPVEEHVAVDSRDDGCRLGDFVDNAFGVFEGLNEHENVGDSEHPFIRDPSLELHHVKKTFGWSGNNVRQVYETPNKREGICTSSINWTRSNGKDQSCSICS
ncbi:hypothetical protein C5167_025769 [Papaver somniferum]|uniref:Uncharacterized protein n=1 Tax=Papaver somniferum TaxID=3469 RepID=A0A4Y7JSF6_PAPSO|nr:hypothetical protein C5167_025769 [Papaver somniferum]